MRSLKAALCVVILIGIIFILHIYNNGLALIDNPKHVIANKRGVLSNDGDDIWEKLQDKETMKLTQELDNTRRVLNERETLIEKLFKRIKDLDIQNEVLQNHLKVCQKHINDLARICNDIDQKDNSSKFTDEENSSRIEGLATGNMVNISDSTIHSSKSPDDGSRRTAFMKNLQFVSFGKWHYFEAEQNIRPSARFIDLQANKSYIGDRHLINAVDKALEMVRNSSELAKRTGNSSRSVVKADLNDGIYRIDMNAGIEYEMYFRDSSSNNVYGINLLTSFTNLAPLKPPRIVSRGEELINLILPISGRLERFRHFIALFTEVCIKQDKHVFLTVVLYGKKDFHYVKKVLNHIKKTHNYNEFQLIMRDKPFSRGRALHDGVSFWDGDNKNVLMFFCDVDVTFNANFLRRCRTYTEPGRKVYYPIVFSLYNPSIVYGNNVPSGVKMLRIGSETGFWRETGYGMTCQYRSDYLTAGGFDLDIEGWGSEDVNLYRSYLRTPVRIIRAPDRGIFHYWHEKKCDVNLNWKQYKACVRSKIRTEGSRAQVGVQWLRVIGELANDDKNFWNLGK